MVNNHIEYFYIINNYYLACLIEHISVKTYKSNVKHNEMQI